MTIRIGQFSPQTFINRYRDPVMETGLYTQLVEEVNSVIIILDETGQVTFCNRYASEYFGYPIEEIIGRSALGTIFPLSAVGELYLQELLATNGHSRLDVVSRVTENTRMRGEQVWIAWTVRQLSTLTANPAGVICIGNDVTALKSIENSLLESKQQILNFLEILESIADPFLSLDERWQITYMNPVAEDLFRGERDSILGMPIWDVLPPALTAMIKDRCQRAHDEGALERFEVFCPPLDSWFEVHVYPSYRGISLYLRNVTDRKQMEAQLLRAQRLETAGRIASQVAHDLTNMLAPIVAYADIIKTRLPEGDPGQQYCDTIMDSIERVADVTQDMLALGRRGVLQQEPVDLNQLVELSVTQSSGIPDALKISLELAPNLPPVNGSPAQLMRVLTNLISNARDAMQDMGLLHIATEQLCLDKPVSNNNQIMAGSYVRITISDTGCGIPSKIREQIFDPFFTTKVSTRCRGSGLGLSIVQAIVEDHHGCLELESEVGKGTTFSIYLPLFEKASQDKPLRKAPEGE